MFDRATGEIIGTALDASTDAAYAALNAAAAEAVTYFDAHEWRWSGESVTQQDISFKLLSLADAARQRATSGERHYAEVSSGRLQACATDHGAYGTVSVTFNVCFGIGL